MESETADTSTHVSNKVSEEGASANHAIAEPPAKAAHLEPSGETAEFEPPTSLVNSEVAAEPANVECTPTSAGGGSSAKANDIVPCPPDASPRGSQPSMFSSSAISAWTKNLKFPQHESQTENSGVSAFARFTSGLGLHLPLRGSDGTTEAATTSTATTEGSTLESFTKGLVDSSRGAVKAMQVKARHIVSQNKRRYQEGEFDLDMTYITENIIAMGFPAGDMSSGLFGFFEGLYRNHMEEVIKFFESHHKGKYKVYNLCSERLYDSSKFEGKVASFPFDDHNCPPILLIPSFCQSAYQWLKQDIENVVVVHCKAGMARTGLMICCLLLYLKFFPTAEEAIDYYNNKRCVDGKALVLPSQIRYVKYYESISTYFKGEPPPGRRCMLRGFRLINCPYWIRPAITISNHSGILFSSWKHPKTKDLMPGDFWMKSPRKGVVVFALPGEPGLTEVAGDFKIQFHESQGNFYCWLNTTMTQNRITLAGSDLDGFDKRKLPSPGFQIEIVMIDYGGTLPSTKPKVDDAAKQSEPGLGSNQTGDPANPNQTKVPGNEENDDVFSESDGEDSGNTKAVSKSHAESVPKAEPVGDLTRQACGLNIAEPPKSTSSSVGMNFEAGKDYSGVQSPGLVSAGAEDIKAMAADASVFSFGDEEDYESD